MPPIQSAIVTLLWLLAASYGVAVLEGLIAPSDGSRRSLRAVVRPLASIVDLLVARRTWPARSDRTLFRSAPVVAVATVAVLAWAIPIGPGLIAGDTPITLFWSIVLLGPFVVSLANAGWSSDSAYGVVGAVRAAAHLVSYEVTLGFAILGPAMAAQSLSLTRIVEAQRHLWYVVWQPLGFLLFLASASFTIYRRPFDLPMAESGLHGGVLAEYSGAALLLFRAALAAILFLVSALGAVLYLGGWHGPPVVGPLLPGVAWMLLKTYAIVAVLLWAGTRVPRLRLDQMLAFSWKIVLPVSFVNLLVVGILILVRS